MLDGPKYVVKIDLSDRGMGVLTTLDPNGDVMLFDTRLEAEEFAKLAWGERGKVEEWQS